MPAPMDPAIAAATINAAGQAGQGALGGLTAFLNRKNARKDYRMMRADAQYDWHQQNAYNSPQAQMQRLKEAGLNPHLVYGNGADATSAQMPKQNEIQHVAMETPRFDAGSVTASYFNTQMQQAQTDNLRVQKTVLEQEALLKTMQQINLMASTDKTKEETTNITMLRESTLEAARKNVEKLGADIESTKANTFYTLQENMRKQQLQPITIQTMNETIKNMFEQRKLSQQQRAESIERINNMIKDGKLKDWEIKLSEQGIRPNDPLWIRKFYDFLNDIDGNQGTIFGKPYEIKVKPEVKSWKNWADRFSPY